MKKKFCPKCGKATEKFYNRLCADCFLAKISVADKLPRKIVVKRCKRCNRFFVGKKIAETAEEAIDFILMKFLERLDIKEIDYRISGNKIFLNAIVAIDDLERLEEVEVRLKEKLITCQYCAMKRTKYYNAILQIRAPKHMMDEILNEVERQIASFKQDRLAFISDIEKRARGIDVYIGSKSAAVNIAKRLKNKFKARIKISRKIGGVKKGRIVYRDTILVLIGQRE